MLAKWHETPSGITRQSTGAKFANLTDHIWELCGPDRKLDMALDYDGLHAKTQRTLIDFLHSELKAGLTFVQSAWIAHSDGHLDHYVQAKRSARKTVETVRHFVSRVSDRAIRTEIERQLAETDRLVSSL